MELFREQAWIAKGRRFAVFDGGYALVSVVQPLISPEDGSPRIEFLTRLRHDDRLHALPPKERPKGKTGPMPKWGKRLSLPRQGGRWVGLWQVGHAFIYGRLRKVRWKEVVCLWHVVGPEVPPRRWSPTSRVQEAVHARQLGPRADRAGTGSTLRSAIPSGGWLPRPQAATGLVGVSGVDQGPDRAYQPGAVGDDEPDAAGSVPPGVGP